MKIRYLIGKQNLTTEVSECLDRFGLFPERKGMDAWKLELAEAICKDPILRRFSHQELKHEPGLRHPLQLEVENPELDLTTGQIRLDTRLDRTDAPSLACVRLIVEDRRTVFLPIGLHKSSFAEGEVKVPVYMLVSADSPHRVMIEAYASIDPRVRVDDENALLMRALSDLAWKVLFPEDAARLSS